MNTEVLLEGEKTAKNAIIYLIFLSILKVTVGIITGMSVIIADAINTIANILGIFASYIGLKLSRKSESKKFEYGYYKIETFAALLVSLGIIYVGYVILTQSIRTFSSIQTGEFRSAAIITTILAIFHSAVLSRKLEKAGRKANSLSLLANARNKRVNIFEGFIVLVSIIANYQKIPYVEGVAMGMIAILILIEGARSTKESLFFLLDYWDNPKMVKKIRKILNQENDLISNVKKLRLRRAGTFIFGEAFVEINPYAGIEDLREELNILQRKIKEIDPYIKNFSIYTHISKTDRLKVAIPIKEGKGLNGKVANSLRETKKYLFALIIDGKIKNTYERALKMKDPTDLADFLKKEKINIVINNNLNSLVYYNLRRTHHILVYPNFSNIQKAEDTIKLLMIDT